MELGLFGTNWQLADPLWLCALAALPLVHWLRRRRPQRALVVPFAARWAGREPTSSKSGFPFPIPWRMVR